MHTFHGESLFYNRLLDNYRIMSIMKKMPDYCYLSRDDALLIRWCGMRVQPVVRIIQGFLRFEYDAKLMRN